MKKLAIIVLAVALVLIFATNGKTQEPTRVVGSFHAHIQSDVPDVVVPVTGGVK